MLKRGKVTTQVKGDHGLGLRTFPRTRVQHDLTAHTFQDLWRFGGGNQILFIRTKTCNKELHYSVNEHNFLEIRGPWDLSQKDDSVWQYIFLFDGFFPLLLCCRHKTMEPLPFRSWPCGYGWNSCTEIIHLFRMKIQWKCGIAFEKLLFIISCHVKPKTRTISKNPGKKIITIFFTEILSSTTVCNIDNNIKCSLSSKLHF